MVLAAIAACCLHCPNKMTDVALIRTARGSSIVFTSLDERTLQPLKTLNPACLGKVPTSGTVLPNATIAKGPRPIALLDTLGRYVKLYGFKQPGSTTMQIFRIDVISRM